MPAAKPIPEGFHTITPYLVVKGAGAAIDFYGRAFGARVLYRHDDPEGKVLNAQLRIGSSMLMINDEMPDFGCFGPAADRNPPVTIHLYVDDVDAVFARAVEAGGQPVMPVSDTFWGDRYGQLKDPFGHLWSVATHTEDLSPDEIAERAKQAFT